MTEWQLTIDCADPGVLVRFWSEALGYVVPDPPDGHATWNDWYLAVGVPADELDLDGDGADRLIDPEGRRPPIWFQVVPESKAVKNRIHLDLQVGGGRSVPLDERRRRVSARVAELVDLGATVHRETDASGHYSVVMLDPAGNEFCVV
jgi:hypothetical protein